MHQQKKFDLCVSMFLSVRDMCHGVLRTCNFVQPKEQWSSACFQQKTIPSADAEGRVLFYFSDGPLVCCQVCMPVSAKTYARCQSHRQTWKEDNCMHDFEGLNCLKMVLLSKTSHCLKFENLCPFRY
jgi:hypothetical protein